MIKLLFIFWYKIKNLDGCFRLTTDFKIDVEKFLCIVTECNEKGNNNYSDITQKINIYFKI